jgi:DUF1009 family protein
MTPRKIGLIAGGGQFPLLVAKSARKEGYQVVAVAHQEETPPELTDLAHEIQWIRLGQLGKLIQFFKYHRVHQAVMVGKISKSRMFSRVRPDLKGLTLFSRLMHRQDDHLLRALAEELEKEGILIQPSHLFLPGLLCPSGCWTQRAPNNREKEDIRLGWQAAKALGQVDVGQSVVIKNRAVVAVEAMEGTDETIKRGGQLARGRAVVVKVSKPNQDLRFDLPAVGFQTIGVMEEYGISALALEAGKTLAFDQEKMIEAADVLKMSIVALKDPGELR